MLDINQLISARIIELEATGCACITTLPEIQEEHEPITIKCDRCKELEYLRSHCTCGVCRECINYLLVEYKQLGCTCTYKEVDQIVVDPETGHETTVKVTVKDVECERCKQITALEKKLSEYAEFEKAYIDEALWSQCRIIEGIIYTPNTLEPQQDKIAELEQRVMLTEEAVMGLLVSNMAL